MTFETDFKIKCCVDQLRSPPKAVIPKLFRKHHHTKLHEHAQLIAAPFTN